MPDASPKFKIVHIIGSLKTGGAENQVVQILNGLDPRLFEKYLIVFKDEQSNNKKKLHGSIRYKHISLKRRGQIACIYRLISFFKKIQPHIVQSHMFHTNLYCAIAAKLAGVPIFITTEHGKNLWKNKIHHWLERNIISPLSTKRIAVSQDIKRIRVSSGDVPVEKIEVITPCVGVPNGCTVSKKLVGDTIGTVGRLVEAKDYSTLIDAFSMLREKNQNLRLIFVGDGPLRTSLSEHAEKMGCKTSIEFVGNQANVFEWLAKFDIFAMSSIREGVPVAMLEAMACGLPVVATAVGGIPEVISSGEDGLLAEPKRPDQLADAIEKLLSDSEFRKKIGQNAMYKIKTRYSQSVICKQYERLYLTLLDQTINVQ